MSYLDMLEEYGVVVTEKQKIDVFYTNIINVIPAYQSVYIPWNNVFSICQKTGVMVKSVINGHDQYIDSSEFITNFLFPSNRYGNPKSLMFFEFLARLVVLFQNDFFKQNTILRSFTEAALVVSKLPYKLCDDKFITIGAEELDKALVIDVAKWLNKYPNSHKTYVIALQHYFDDNEPRDIADNLRLSFETFLQEFLGNTKNLDNNINEVGAYLKKFEINKEIRNMFTTLIEYYKLHNDKTAKHNTDTDKGSIEFLLYQTGVFMRFLLKIRQDKEDGFSSNNEGEK